MKEMCDDFVVEQNAVSVMEARRCPCQNRPNDTTSTDTIIQMDCNAWLINKIGLSQAYVAPQPNANTMSQEQSLVCGTAFGDLVQPYIQGSNLTKFL